MKWTTLFEEENVIVGSCTPLMWQTILMYPVNSFHKNRCLLECRKLEKMRVHSLANTIYYVPYDHKSQVVIAIEGTK